MGGIGSGQWERDFSKATVEDYPSLDIRRWHREGRLTPPSGRSWAHRPGFVKLVHTTSGPGGAVRRVKTVLRLAWTPCHYGGYRAWVCCQACGRRAGKLYLFGRVWACAPCGGLAYPSTRESERDRRRRKARKIIQKLGGRGYPMEPFPAKPVGMHWKTYERLWGVWVQERGSIVP